jgi:dihydroorotase
MENKFDLLLKSGNVTFKSENNWKTEVTDIGIKSGKIVAIGNLDNSNSIKTQNCKGLNILPGFIDSQVHLREPGLEHKEDFSSGSAAAILGGITSVFDMPNTKPPTIDEPSWNLKMNRAKDRFWCNYAFYIGATLNNIKELANLEILPGCCGTKIFMGSSTGDLLVDEMVGLKQILSTLKRNVAVHSEDEELLKKQIHFRINGAPSSHPLWRNEEVALVSTQKLLKIALELKKKVHILHVTTRQEMELLSKFKDISTVEVTPQHLTFSAPEIYERIGTFAQMNPPIRDKSHQDALWKGISNGTVDVLGSDHAPHTKEEKLKEYPNSPSGMPGVQTILPVMLNHVNQKKLSLYKLVELMSYNPTKIFNIKNKGDIQIGYDADLSIVDLNKKWTITNEWIKSKCGWTPFDGYQIQGYIHSTVVGGKFAQIEGELMETPNGQAILFTN